MEQVEASSSVLCCAAPRVREHGWMFHSLLIISFVIMILQKLPGSRKRFLNLVSVNQMTCFDSITCQCLNSCVEVWWNIKMGLLAASLWALKLVPGGGFLSFQFLFPFRFLSHVSLLEWLLSFFFPHSKMWELSEVFWPFCLSVPTTTCLTSLCLKEVMGREPRSSRILSLSFRKNQA